MITSRSRTAAVALLAALTGGLLTAAAVPASAYGGPANEISYVGANGEVYTELPDGSHKTQITSTGASKKCDPAFSPDHTQIAYVGNDGGVYVINNAPESAANPPVLLNGSIANWQLSGSRRPTWSPDGLTILFPLGLNVRPTSHPTDTYNLYEVTRPAVGGQWSNPVQLTDLPTGGWALQPRFSPSGTALSYSYRAPNTTTDVLYVSDWPLPAVPATTPPGNAIPRAGEAILSSWSPDGTKIAYGAYTCNVGVQVLTVSRSNGTWVGGQPSTVSNGGGCGVAWSTTNGNLITYADSTNVYVLDLTKGRKGVSLGAGSQPGW
jgi:hypothetical protein